MGSFGSPTALAVGAAGGVWISLSLSLSLSVGDGPIETLSQKVVKPKTTHQPIDNLY